MAQRCFVSKAGEYTAKKTNTINSQINDFVSVLEQLHLAQRGDHEIHLNKPDKIYSKQSADHVPQVVLCLVSAKIPLSEMGWSHGMNLCGQDGDIRELLDYRFGP